MNKVCGEEIYSLSNSILKNENNYFVDFVYSVLF